MSSVPGLPERLLSEGPADRWLQDLSKLRTQPAAVGSLRPREPQPGVLTDDYDTRFYLIANPLVHGIRICLGRVMARQAKVLREDSRYTDCRTTFNSDQFTTDLKRAQHLVCRELEARIMGHERAIESLKRLMADTLAVTDSTPPWNQPTKDPDEH